MEPYKGRIAPAGEGLAIPVQLANGTFANRRRGVGLAVGEAETSPPSPVAASQPRPHATASCRLRPSKRNNTAVQKNEHERKQRFMPEKGTFSGRGSGRARRLLFSFQRIPNLRRELLVPLLQRLLLLLKRPDPEFERLDALV